MYLGRVRAERALAESVKVKTFCGRWVKEKEGWGPEGKSEGALFMRREKDGDAPQ